MKNNEKTEQFVSETLMRIGIPCNIKGFRYVKEAVLLAMEDVDLTHALTVKLYPDVAKVFDVTPNKVERGIRHAIDYIWEKDNLPAIKRILGPAATSKRMTNGEFIATLVERMKTQSIPRAS